MLSSLLLSGFAEPLPFPVTRCGRPPLHHLYTPLSRLDVLCFQRLSSAHQVGISLTAAFLKAVRPFSPREPLLVESLLFFKPFKKL